MPEHTKRQKVVVIGAGPVGALAALYAASRGDDVEIYELRGDLRDPSTTPLNFTKSINLALSERGINSMRRAEHEGLIDTILDGTIPMHGRMIHGRSKIGDLYQESQEYDVHGRSIYAVDRADLNKRLLDALENMPNVAFFFNHKLTGADFKTNSAWFERRSQLPKTDHAQNPTQPLTSKQDEDRAPEIEVKFDFMIGADGAHSAARYHLMKYAQMNYQQEYIDCLWCEFHIKPSGSDFAISPNHLHIWPGGDFMFIAIPSLDHSFTCTLFAPHSTFAMLSKSPEEALPLFFAKNFPGVAPDLISNSDLVTQFSENPHLPLISIKCTPYHYDSCVIIVGDAAHAMVPFYGQGMNAGLEDVRVLFEFLDQYGLYTTGEKTSRECRDIRMKALSAYTKYRTPDAAAINDLALRNYLEMRSSVTSPIYRLRKFIEETTSKYLPSFGWATQYSRVSFENVRYSEVERATRRQGKLILYGTLGFLGLGIAAPMVFRYWPWRNPRPNGRRLAEGFTWLAKRTQEFAR